MMENQHRKISGYRELSEAEIALMNEAKSLGAEVGDLLSSLKRDPNGEGFDQRAVALAATHIQTGFMWLVRSIARPEGFV
jgi:hypothetical protein